MIQDVFLYGYGFVNSSAVACCFYTPGGKLTVRGANNVEVISSTKVRCRQPSLALDYWASGVGGAPQVKFSLDGQVLAAAAFAWIWFQIKTFCNTQHRTAPHRTTPREAWLQSSVHSCETAVCTEDGQCKSTEKN